MRGLPSPLIGQTVGNYRVDRFLGAGGMGTVYVGFDATLEREVAIKVLHYETRGSEARARFLREGRALSRLHDPRICQIHDFVQRDDGDFLILELVQGESLGDLLKEGSPRLERMQVARQLAAVLAVAHRHGVVHRDLKPDNVMVTPQGDVKVLDFGLALLDPTLGLAGGVGESGEVDGDTGTGAGRAPEDQGFDSSSLETTVRGVERGPGGATENITAGGSEGAERLTRQGSILGTINYMSPEQARGEDLDASTDLYSLGLIFHELFCSGKPYPETISFPKRLALVESGTVAPPDCDDQELAQLIGDLESSDATARPSAEEVVRRLDAILDRPRRERQRRTRLLLAAVSVALGLLYVVDLARDRAALERERNEAVAARLEAEAARDEAEQARQEAEAVKEFLIELFQESEPAQALGSAPTAREVLDRGRARIRERFEAQPLLRAHLMTEISMVYLKLGSREVGEELVREALALRQEELPRGHPDLAMNLHHLGIIRFQEGDLEEAEKLYDQATQIWEGREGNERDLAQVLSHRGILARREGRIEDAIGFYQRAAELQERLHGPDHPEVATVWILIGVLEAGRGEVARAEDLYVRALRVQRDHLDPNHPELARTLTNLALLYTKEERLDEAEPLLVEALRIQEDVLGKDHPHLASTLNTLAELYRQRGSFDEAERLLRRALEIDRKTYGEEHPDAAISINNLADVLREAGDDAQARDLYKEALGVFENTLGKDHLFVSYPLWGLARLDVDQSREASEALARRALDIRRRHLGDDHADVVEIESELARIAN